MFSTQGDLDNCTIQGLTKRRWVMSSSSRAASQNDTRSNTGAVLSQIFAALSIPQCELQSIKLGDHTQPCCNKKILISFHKDHIVHMENRIVLYLNLLGTYLPDLNNQ